MEEIKEEDEEEGRDKCSKEEEEMYHILIKVYEELLKIIQKGSTEQFLRVYRADCPSLGPC